MFALVSFSDQSSMMDAIHTLDQLEFVLVSSGFSLLHSEVSSDPADISAKVLISYEAKSTYHTPIDRCSFVSKVYKTVNSCTPKLFIVEAYCTKEEALSSLTGINISKSYVKVNESAQLEHVFLANRFEVYELASIRGIVKLDSVEVAVSDANLAHLFSDGKSFSIDNGRILVSPVNNMSAYCVEVLNYDPAV